MKLEPEVVKPGKYVVAVSGGVDSVVLLDMLSNNPGLDLVVAHYDHNMRFDSAQDTQFVKELAQKYGFEFLSNKAEVEVKSEEEARKLRYEFLDKAKRSTSSNAIIIAHHQDDVIETMMINLLRGTSNTGLASLSSNNTVIRPLLDMSKEQISEYARINKLEWREDSTNSDNKFLRNYIRNVLIPDGLAKNPNFKQEMLQINKSARSNRAQLEDALAELAQALCLYDKKKVTIDRSQFTMLPNEVASALLVHVIKGLPADVEINKKQIARAIRFLKTGKNNKHMEFSGNVNLQISNSLLEMMAI